MSQMAPVLRNVFLKITGAERLLSDADLLYLAEKLHGGGYKDYDMAGPITFQQFAKVRITELALTSQIVCPGS
jgi:hypothetical protein